MDKKAWMENLARELHEKGGFNGAWLYAENGRIAFMLTDDSNPIRICRQCQKIFVASRPKVVFCSPQCNNRYNVYKSRKKKQMERLQAYKEHLED